MAALVASSLTACYVVPVDPSTGRAYPVPVTTQDPVTGVVSTGAPIVYPTTGIAPPAHPGPPAATVLTARLYPLNTQGNKGGMLTAVVVDNNSGRGTFTLSYLGDTLQGEASRVDSGYAAFGRIHNEVLGVQQRSFNGRRGIANAFGSKGVNVQCEYLISGPAMGTGACQFSDGAKYQMHFGS